MIKYGVEISSFLKLFFNGCFKFEFEQNCCKIFCQKPPVTKTYEWELTYDSAISAATHNPVELFMVSFLLVARSEMIQVGKEPRY